MCSSAARPQCQACSLPRWVFRGKASSCSHGRNKGESWVRSESEMLHAFYGEGGADPACVQDRK